MRGTIVGELRCGGYSGGRSVEWGTMGGELWCGEDKDKGNFGKGTVVWGIEETLE